MAVLFVFGERRYRGNGKGRHEKSYLLPVVQAENV
jgi:hypothetical protein